MCWNAAMTRASPPSSSCASSAEEPCAGGVKSRPPPKVSGTTVLITIFPRHASLMSGSVVARPFAGTASTTTSAPRTASAFDMPLTLALDRRAASSAALPRAPSASREPMMTSWPRAAHRAPTPDPPFPAPPTMAIRMRSFLVRLSEQVPCRIAKQLAAGPFTRLPVEAADDRDRDAAQLAHHGFGGGCHLVGEREDRGLQHVAGRVTLAEIVGDRLEAGETDGDVAQPFAPWPSERVGADDGQRVPRQFTESVPDPARRAIGILRKKARSVRIDVGLIHAGVRADPPMMGLDDHETEPRAHHPPTLAQDDLGQQGIASELLGELSRPRGRCDAREPHHSPLGFRDDLLADDEHVAIEKGRALPRGRVHDEPCHIVAADDLRQRLDADDLVPRRGHATSGRRGERQGPTRAGAWRSGSRGPGREAARGPLGRRCRDRGREDSKRPETVPAAAPLRGDCRTTVLRT